MPLVDSSYEPGSANSLATYYQNSQQNRNILAAQDRANKLGDLQYQQKLDEENTARALKSYFANKNPNDPDFRQGLSMIVGPQGVMDYDTKQAATQKARIEAMKHREDFLDQGRRNLSLNDSDENVVAWGQDGVIKGLFTEEEAKRHTAELLAIPRGERGRRLAMSGATAEQLKPTTSQINQGAQTSLVQTPAGGGAPTTVGTYAHILTEKEKADIEHQRGMLKVAKDRLNAEIDSTGDLSPEALAVAAQMYVQTGILPNLGLKSGPVKQKILNLAAQYLKTSQTPAPNAAPVPFDAASAAATVVGNKQDAVSQQATLNAFNRGEQAKKITALNTATDHLDTLSDLVVGLKNGDNRIVNAVGNTVSKWSGGAAPTNFAAIKPIVMDEVLKAVVANGGSAAERQAMDERMQAMNSPDQLFGVIEQFKGLMGGQLGSLETLYETGTGRKDFRTRLTPGTQRVMDARKASTAPSNANAIPTGAPDVSAAMQWVNDPKNANDPRLPAVKAKLGVR
jgi:hypothetical protein